MRPPNLPSEIQVVLLLLVLSSGGSFWMLRSQELPLSGDPVGKPGGFIGYGERRGRFIKNAGQKRALHLT